MGLKNSSKQRLLTLQPTNKRPVFIRFINTPDIPKKEFYIHWEGREGSPGGGGSLEAMGEVGRGSKGSGWDETGGKGATKEVMGEAGWVVRGGKIGKGRGNGLIKGFGFEEGGGDKVGEERERLREGRKTGSGKENAISIGEGEDLGGG